MKRNLKQVNKKIKMFFYSSRVHGSFFPRSYKAAQRWQHLALVYDKQKLQGYVDGVPNTNLCKLS